MALGYAKLSYAVSRLGGEAVGTADLVADSGFGLRTLQKDSNCIAIQDPSTVWGLSDFLARRNLLLATATLATQTKTTEAKSYTLYIKGTGSVTLSGTATGTLSGTGASDRVSLVFTATAGTLTLTVSGSVTEGHLTLTSTTDHSYQAITDWTTEQYAHAAQKQVPWLRRNMYSNTEASIVSWSQYRGTLSLSNDGVPTCQGQTYVWTEDNTASATHFFDSSAVGATLVADKNTLITASRYIKAGTRNWAAMFMPNVGSTFAWFDLSSGAVGSKESGVLQSTITPAGDGWYRCSITVYPSSAGNIGAARVYISTGNGISSYSGDGSSYIKVGPPQMEIGSVSTPYQPILATWDATYTANAIAAGYPISIWQDSGTIAVNGDNQAIGKMLNAKMDGLYTAIQSTAANQPKWRLDSNGKPYIERDLVNDALPITLPLYLSDAQLGPDLVAPYGTFTNDEWWTKGANTTITGGALVVAASATATTGPASITSGEAFLITYTVVVYTSGTGVRVRPGGTSVGTYRTAPGTYSELVTANANGTTWIIETANFVGSIDNVSIKKVTGTNVIYTAEDNVTLKDSGLTLSGSYAPITPSKDYGRIIMAADSQYDAKIIKYLDSKRGRQDSLGPELWVDANVGVSGESQKLGVQSYRLYSSVGALSYFQTIPNVFTIGKTYLFTYTVASIAIGGTYSITDTATRTAALGTQQVVLAFSSGNYIKRVSAIDVTISNVSVREVLI